MCTKNGIIKKTSLEAYSRPRQSGINAITVRDGDHLLEALLTSGKDEIILAKKSGRAIRFNEGEVRAMGRTASGVKGVTLENKKDEVIGMIAIKDKATTILVVSEKGYGKRSFLVDPESGEDEYRVTGRGGKGVKTINVTEKTGGLVGLLDVTEKEDLMITCVSGITIRMAVASVSEQGRATQGVKLIRVDEDDAIAAITQLDEKEEETELAEGEVTDIAAEGTAPDTASDITETPEDNTTEPTDNQ